MTAAAIWIGINWSPSARESSYSPDVPVSSARRLHPALMCPSPLLEMVDIVAPWWNVRRNSPVLLGDSVLPVVQNRMRSMASTLAEQAFRMLSTVARMLGVKCRRWENESLPTVWNLFCSKYTRGLISSILCQPNKTTRILNVGRDMFRLPASHIAAAPQKRPVDCRAPYPRVLTLVMFGSTRTVRSLAGFRASRCSLL